MKKTLIINALLVSSHSYLTKRMPKGTWWDRNAVTYISDTERVNQRLCSEMKPPAAGLFGPNIKGIT